MILGCTGLDGVFRRLVLDPSEVRESDLETLAEMAPAGEEAGLELALRQVRALDRSRVTRRFFVDFRARRDAVATAWRGLPPEADRERAQLALLLLSRLTFLSFLQRRGALAGDRDYLVGLLRRWGDDAPPGGIGGQSFFRARLLPLFFGALNRRPEDRSEAARSLGALPYLNGGLFERHALERQYPELDLPDAEVRACVDDLLERYRFAAREGAAGEGQGVTPEILGEVFEGLMAPGRRAYTGSFYTPAPVVQHVVREALTAYVAGTGVGPGAPSNSGSGSAHATASSATSDTTDRAAGTRYRTRRALERVRVLDPACGSGAFLLGALERLTAMRVEVSDRPTGEIRRDVVGRALHGVDLLDDAALLCSLRLWLALSVEDGEIRPLPNLDRRIRQGDALVDPLDLGSLGTGSRNGGQWQPLHDPEVRVAIRALAPAGRRYLESTPSDRAAARESLEAAELRLGRLWVEGARRSCVARSRRLRAQAKDRDLFGGVPATARRAAAALEGVEARLSQLEDLATEIEERAALPFFSFGIHFADAPAGFDVILSNPPWVRSHRWPHRLRRMTDRFEVCRDTAWRGAAELTGAPAGAGAQVDLSLLFVERCIRLLAPGGVLAVLLPAKALRAIYGGAARRMLLRELEIVRVEDHSLDQRSIFRADAFAAVLIARRRPEQTEEVPVAGVSAGVRDPARVQVRQVRRGLPPNDFTLPQSELSLFRGDPAAPWLLVPPAVGAVVRRMQRVGPPLGRHPELRVRRGIMTGANDVLLLSSVRPRLGGWCEIEAEGLSRARRDGRSGRDYRAVIETQGVRPLVRGADVDAFRYRTSSYTVWCHGPDSEPRDPTPRLQRYLSRHRERLTSRSGWREGMPLGAVFRLTPHSLGHKVAWHDLSDTLRAVALPPRVRWEGAERELVPLNTVYFLPTEDRETSVLLAGLLNALPARVFIRAVAERAKDGRFRFFAWTVSTLPLPPEWRTTAAAAELLEVSRAAHRGAGLDPEGWQRLDRAAARLYGLERSDMEVFRDYDRWLRGES